MSSDTVATVAAHYNERRGCGFGARRRSPIFHLRNFNNWVKATLIQQATLRADVVSGGSALDLCCGKGGDLFKWRAARVKRLVCADLAEESVAECKRKFYQMRLPSVGVFLAADCAERRLADMHPEAARSFDVCSCQFALHYGFESAARAERMLANAAEGLRPGGVFVGTLPDAYEIVKRMRASASADGSFGNELYRVTPRFDAAAKPDLFGARYDFRLEGVVDCPEFLVYFPLLVSLAKRFDLELVERLNFAHFYAVKQVHNRDLLRKMESFETVDRRQPVYDRVKKFFDENEDAERAGTMSDQEWEVACELFFLLFIAHNKY